MKAATACEQYLELPTLVQPHTLDAEVLTTIAESLEATSTKTKMAHFLGAADCRIDLLHIASSGGGTQPNLAATVDHAREQVAKCGEKLASIGEGSNVFPRVYQVSLADSYLGFYQDARTLPGGGWDIAGAQKDAYANVQTTFLNPLLESVPRPHVRRSDERDIEEVLRGLVVAQTLHRLQATDPQAVFGVFPANLRERNSPQGGEPHTSFKLKVLLPDQTFYPIRHPSRTEDEYHPLVAHIAGRAVEGHEHYSVRTLAKIMRAEVQGDRLSSFQERLLDGMTARVLGAMNEINPIGESIYPPDDSRTRFAGFTKQWLFKGLLPDLQEALGTL